MITNAITKDDTSYTQHYLTMTFHPSAKLSKMTRNLSSSYLCSIPPNQHLSLE